MTEHERELAENCYGYGRWDAPYWFIGPEQGQGTWENDELDRRYKAFMELSKDGLCDCMKFHDYIGETSWRTKLQATWKRLILVLKSYKGLRSENDELSEYQRTQWGSADTDGETCVIELSGLPANSFKVPRERETFREARIQNILCKARAAKPKFIVIYGKSQRKYWEKIAAIEPSLNIKFEPHPVRGPRRKYWIDRATSYHISK